MPKNIYDDQKFNENEPAKDPIFISKEFKIIRISLKKGLTIEPHYGSHVVFFYVLRGKGIFTTGSGEIELGENDYISLKETEPRGIKSLDDLVVLVIRN
ncbi:hypothetical protein LCGC14_0822400 [marine sediment metagenome]|uniref:Cupin type-2 domain-containing protein n=1 Tax=marine sediment metagenome TaxID=412755 RepID=A0A0F9S369_9ZZZZ|nr:cupin domain-containing protein [bacterium]